jgi:hypothetical protein
MITFGYCHAICGGRFKEEGKNICFVWKKLKNYLTIIIMKLIRAEQSHSAVS